jgi:DNA-binding NarL/FixJ family response regulator
MNLTPSTEKKLTWSEQQVLQLISRGCSIEEISAVLMFSSDIIEALKQNISRKLDMPNAVEAVHVARAMNLM